jgi:SAM-dependent methyltransferase
VADVGAGDAPYRELFAHTHYSTIDWERSVHEGARGADIAASADQIPVADESYDAVLLTQVLEHVPDPLAVLREAARILVRGGGLFVTVPLAWELHEMPYDYYRYTPYSLAHLAESAGFDQVEIQPRNDCFSTVAQLLLNLRHVMGSADDGLEQRREDAREVLSELASEVAKLAPLDSRRILPLGYSMSARRIP